MYKHQQISTLSFWFCLTSYTTWKVTLNMIYGTIWCTWTHKIYCWYHIMKQKITSGISFGFCCSPLVMHISVGCLSTMFYATDKQKSSLQESHTITTIVSITALEKLSAYINIKIVHTTYSWCQGPRFALHPHLLPGYSAVARISMASYPTSSPRSRKST